MTAAKPVPVRRRRAKGATIQGFYTITPPATPEERAAVIGLVDSHVMSPKLSDEERERIKAALLDEPTAYRESASYQDNLAARRERRKRKRETERLEEAA